MKERLSVFVRAQWGKKERERKEKRRKEGGRE
jgi:hypothetical protein